MESEVLEWAAVILAPATWLWILAFIWVQLRTAARIRGLWEAHPAKGSARSFNSRHACASDYWTLDIYLKANGFFYFLLGREDYDKLIAFAHANALHADFKRAAAIKPAYIFSLAGADLKVYGVFPLPVWLPAWLPEP